MDDSLVKKFLRYYYPGIVDFALSLASLSDKELQAVNLCGKRGLTIEQAAEEAECSVNTMKTRWATARKRLCKAWAGVELIEIIANM